MLVCPSCRNENHEDARFCHVCGRSLEPVAGPLRRSERGDVEPEGLDDPPPRRQSVWPAIALGVVVALGLAAWGVWSASRPNPCQGKYTSVLFGYCATIPEGWTGGSQVAAEENLDQFVPPQEDAATFVRVQQILDPATQTAQYVQQFRISQEAEGLEPSPVEVVPIDGEEALAWNYTIPGEQGEPPLQLREVITVRTEGAWRITLVATDESYGEARLAFEQLLQSWRWKS